MFRLVAEPIDGIKRLAVHMGRLGGHVLFPPTCLSCRRIVAGPGSLCPRCWPQVHFLAPPWCAVSGMPFAYEMGAGAISPAVMAKPPAFDIARAAVAYDGIARRIVQDLKYGDRTDLAPWMARFMVVAGRDLLEDADLLVPVPLHRDRFLSRRFNQSAELARAVARMTGIALAPDLVVRRKKTRQQVGLRAAEREANVRGAFALGRKGRAAIAGRRVVIVDDVLTTGATVASLARTLRRGGAARIGVLTFARVIPGDFRPVPDRTI